MFLKKAAKTTPPLIFFMVHLLHRLYGVDTPGDRLRGLAYIYTMSQKNAPNLKRYGSKL